MASTIVMKFATLENVNRVASLFENHLLVVVDLRSFNLLLHVELLPQFATMYATSNWKIVNINVFLHAMLVHVVHVQSWSPKCARVATEHFPRFRVTWSRSPAVQNAANNSHVENTFVLALVIPDRVYRVPRYASNHVKSDVSFVNMIVVLTVTTAHVRQMNLVELV